MSDDKKQEQKHSSKDGNKDKESLFGQQSTSREQRTQESQQQSQSSSEPRQQDDHSRYSRKQEIARRFEEPPRRDPLLEDYRPHPSLPPRMGPRIENEDYHRPIIHFPPRVGGTDLDPLGRGVGGGMLMDPRELMDPFATGGRNPGGPRLPPGAVPPGARFDPFGPPGLGPFGPRRPPGGGRGGSPPGTGPNPDHFKPPDGYDDMFM